MRNKIRLFTRSRIAIISLFSLLALSRPSEAASTDYLPNRVELLSSDASYPFDIVLLPNGMFCISALDPNGLVFSSRSDLKQVKHIPMKATPSFLQLSSARPELYVLSSERPTIYVFEPQKMELLRLIHLPAEAHSVQMAITQDGKTAFVGDGLKPLLYVVDLQTGKVTKQISLSAPARRLLLSETLGNLYVGLQESVDKPTAKSPMNQVSKDARIDVFDAKTQKRTETIVLNGKGVSGLAVDATRRTLFVLSYRGAFLSAVTVGKIHKLKTTPQPKIMPGDQIPNGSGLLYDEKNSYLYVASEGLNATWLSLVNSYTLEITNRVPRTNGRMTLWRSKEKKQSLLYTPGFADGTLNVIDVSALKNIKTTAVSKEIMPLKE